MGLVSRWWQFLRERHEPFSISLMVLAFYGANVGMVWTQGADQPPFPLWRAAGGYLLIWFLFLHMRLFDEVKDYAVDKEHNPHRPLARGLIGLGEFGTATLLVILAEAALAANLGWAVFATYALALCFTLLMRMEFFVGDWLRPQLELYAITHTFSASMMGVVMYAVVRNQQLIMADLSFLAFALGNWFVFNVFEFGRKTFAREEERDGVDSYSARLYPWGAVVLLVVNMAIGYGLLWYAAVLKYGGAPNALMIPSGIIALLVAIAGIGYAAKANLFWAKAYRGTVTFYLLAYHIAIAVGCYALLPTP